MLTRLSVLICDNLVEIGMVSVSGHRDAELIKANKTEHSNLFGDCCGEGGGNFGFLTKP
ncbi:hypothetical protein [Bacillus salipaludis]|uniref:hypothetical protein n=1 Tax=Bacillus salipaludis TaxID=2547811 RepID=UPI002E22FA19|nr:hypothetical protein [Bacillus salipaludis]